MKLIKIAELFPKDHITREAGEQLRQRIHAAYLEKQKVTVDFEGVIIASTSFFDEGFAKLVQEGWDDRQFQTQIEILNMHLRDQEVLQKVCAYRGLKNIGAAITRRTWA